jgi:hypothetical protein
MTVTAQVVGPDPEQAEHDVGLADSDGLTIWRALRSTPTYPLKGWSERALGVGMLARWNINLFPFLHKITRHSHISHCIRCRIPGH